LRNEALNWTPCQRGDHLLTKVAAPDKECIGDPLDDTRRAFARA
jgi:hypothetical protein